MTILDTVSLVFESIQLTNGYPVCGVALKVTAAPTAYEPALKSILPIEESATDAFTTTVGSSSFLQVDRTNRKDKIKKTLLI